MWSWPHVDTIEDSTPKGIHEKEEQYRRCVTSEGFQHAKLVADAWCAAFVWKKKARPNLPEPITHELFKELENNPQVLPEPMARETYRLAGEYAFFHWHLAFPEVFSIPEMDEKPENDQTGWSGGFDCVLGNPPWERIKLQEKEWFATRDPDIANASNAAARRKKINRLIENDPDMYAAFTDARRRAEGESKLVRDTGLFPLCGRGDVNTYSIFSELKRGLLNPFGRVGCIVPSGIATDDTTKFFFQSLMDTSSLMSLYSFENEEFIFPSVHHATKFCLLTMGSPGLRLQRAMDFVFFARQVKQLDEKERHFTLTANDIAILNPNTRTCPIFKYKQDAELTKYIYGRVPVLLKEITKKEPEENPWGIKFATMFHMANDSGLFRTKEQLELEGYNLIGNIFRQEKHIYLPLYEGKMFWHFDHRFGTYEGQTQAQANQGKLPELSAEQHLNPEFFSIPRYWVAEEHVKARVPKRPELLASALDLPEEGREEAVKKAFCYWAAGYWKKAGDEEQAKKLLEVAIHPSISDSQIDILNKWLLDMKCERMQERFPLTHVDVDRMTDSSYDLFPLAEELLDRFSPKCFVAFRDVTSAVVLRTAVFSIVPFVAVGHTAPLVFFDNIKVKNFSNFLACMNSLVLDYCARQSVGGSHLTYSYLKQLPVPVPNVFDEICPWDTKTSIGDWCFQRVTELTFTAWDSEPFSMDGDYFQPPFCWDNDRRFIIRAELDAALFYLYLGGEERWSQDGSNKLLVTFPTPRHAVEYILNTFRILRERDEKAHGYFRTKDTILEIYDEMALVMVANQATISEGREPNALYQTRIDPPPGPLFDQNGDFVPMEQWDQNSWPPHIHRPRGWQDKTKPIPVTVPYKEDPQVFPWKGREQFIQDLIPHLVNEQPGLLFETYRTIAFLATWPGKLRDILSEGTAIKFGALSRQTLNACTFPDSHHFRPWQIRNSLEERKRYVTIDPQSGAATVPDNIELPELPINIKPLVPFVLIAAIELDRMKQDATEKVKLDTIKAFESSFAA